MTLIRPGGCPGSSESSLGVHVILLVLSCCGLIIKQNTGEANGLALSSQPALNRTEKNGDNEQGKTRHETQKHTN